MSSVAIQHSAPGQGSQPLGNECGYKRQEKPPAHLEKRQSNGGESPETLMAYASNTSPRIKKNTLKRCIAQVEMAVNVDKIQRILTSFFSA
jgi:hypothetical protein